MGLFSKLTEDKQCGICGKELGLLGKSKLEDGYLCKECRKKLSPFFTGLRHSTLSAVQHQIDCREANKELVERFNPTRKIGFGWRVLIDDTMRAIVVTCDGNWRSSNPDVIPFDKVRGVDMEVLENREELTYKDSGGNRKHYEPPRYEVRHDFWAKVRTDISYVGIIKFKLNEWDVGDRWSPEYGRYQRMADELRDALDNLDASSPSQPVSREAYVQSDAGAQAGNAVPEVPRFCSSCGAQTSSSMRFCESCGSQLVA